ncbi:hypothetical protein HYV10_01265 [Candidatus Dependentiae bacterium]|nr:hypothetical protein [Candidatus Dependentiae bacterium]
MKFIFFLIAGICTMPLNASRFGGREVVDQAATKAVQNVGRAMRPIRMRTLEYLRPLSNVHSVQDFQLKTDFTPGSFSDTEVFGHDPRLWEAPLEPKFSAPMDRAGLFRSTHTLLAPVKREPVTKKPLTKQDAIKFLGLTSDNPTEKEIQSAYVAKTLLYHPDAGGTGADFVNLTEARDILLGKIKPPTNEIKQKPASWDFSDSSIPTNRVTDEKLWAAIKSGDVEQVESLIKSGQANPNVVYENVYYARLNKNNSFLRKFYNDIMGSSMIINKGTTPLEVAASNRTGSTEMLKVLLQNGARVGIDNALRRSINSDTNFELLLNNGATINYSILEFCLDRTDLTEKNAERIARGILSYGSLAPNIRMHIVTKSPILTKAFIEAGVKFTVDDFYKAQYISKTELLKHNAVEGLTPKLVKRILGVHQNDFNMHNKPGLTYFDRRFFHLDALSDLIQAEEQWLKENKPITMASVLQESASHAAQRAADLWNAIKSR